MIRNDYRIGSNSRLRHSQSGAALYVALIMIVLLALIGIVGMQVAGLQERMATNYRSVNQAFQAAEAGVRARECFLEGVVNRTGVCGGDAAAIEQVCDDGYDPTTWAAEQSIEVPQENRVRIRAIGPCVSGNSALDMGVAPVSEDPNPVYQVTVYATNDAANANAAVDTIFRP